MKQSIATHCNRWYGHQEFVIFLGLIVKLDSALKLCLLSIINLGGIFGGFIGTCGGLWVCSFRLQAANRSQSI